MIEQPPDELILQTHSASVCQVLDVLEELKREMLSNLNKDDDGEGYSEEVANG